MAKRTRKVGITGKYGTRYGASLRKVVKKEPGQIFSRIYQRSGIRGQGLVSSDKILTCLG